MNLLKRLFFVALMLISANVFAEKILVVTSPDKQIKFWLSADKDGLFYKVAYKGILMADKSRLKISFKEGGDFDHGLVLSSVKFDRLIDDYTLIAGKASKVHSECNRIIVPVKETTGAKRELNIEIRVFNDGAAFRYEIPEQSQWKTVNITDEVDEFNLTENPKMTTMLRVNYTTSHEGLYTKTTLKDLKSDTLMDSPVLFEFPGGKYMAITEAALLDYAGMYLMKHNGVLETRLSPLPDVPGVKVIAKLPHNSPWRVMMISDRVGTFIESNILTNLNEPCKTKDLSWLKPGKTTFPWWNGNIERDTDYAFGNNYETNMYYVHFCAKYGLKYHTVVEYGQHGWYVDDGADFGTPGPHADPSTAVPGLDMQQLCDSAAAVGVGIRVWVHWAALYPRLDSTFTRYEKWGIKGLMCDFMDRDDQEMVNIQTEILQKAMQHHLHIQFHGAYHPTGTSRTYPNEFTREGTLNYENDKWIKLVTPDADIDIPFTRLLAGSTDYHLGGFRNVSEEQFRPHARGPMVIGTRCHMLAMYVILEDAQGMMCDNPDAYINQPGFDFLQAVPLTWDETKVIDAKPSEFVAIARRKGKEWYVGAITNHESRTVEHTLDFLPAGNYTAEIWSDAPASDPDLNHLVKVVKQVTSNTPISMLLAGGGGQVMRIYPAK
jgi:alpha-glucosidase